MDDILAPPETTTQRPAEAGMAETTVFAAAEQDPEWGPASTPSTTTPAASHVFAIGRVRPQFPSLSVEKEFAQAMGNFDSTGMTDPEAFHAVVSNRANRYLARQLCWTMSIEGLEMYLLVPRDSADLDLLVEAVRPRASPDDLDVVVGVRGPVAPPAVCSGVQLPIVVFDQVYSFDRSALIGAIPQPEGSQQDRAQFEAAAAELFDRLMQLADNAGATDEHRAVNYLAVRYPAIYARAAQAAQDSSSLSSVEVLPSRLSSARIVVNVIFAYTHRQTDVTEKFFVRVDVTEEFPFLVTKLGPYFDR